MKRNVTTIFAAIFLLVGLTIGAATYNYTATEDAYVRGGSNGDTNYGSATDLVVKQGTVSTYFRKTLVKFDLTGESLSGITSAKVKLYCNSAGGSLSVTAYELADSWAEGTVTWNSAPALGTTITSTTVSASGVVYEWDVTNYAATQAAGDEIVSVAFYDASASNLLAEFNSKEAASSIPVLEVITGGTPSPSPVPTSTPTGLDLYLLIGQSNMAGRADIETQDEDPVTDAWLFTDTNSWEPASNPLNKYSTVRKDISLQKLGPGYTFAKKIIADNPGVEVGLVVNARGGTSIYEWEKGDLYYNEALSRVQAAMASGTLKGVIWHQGESNSGDSGYVDKLETVINDLRADLSLPALPWIAGQLRYSEARAAFNALILTLPGQVAYTDVATAEGLTDIGDGTHLDSASQRTLGERYAEKINVLVYGHTPAPTAAPTATPTQSPTPSPSPASLTFVSTEAAYVRGGAYKDTNYGSEIVLRVKVGTNSDYMRKSYVKFDLTGETLSNVQSAKVKLYCTLLDSPGLSVTVMECSDNWSESTITWTNVPAAGNTIGATSVTVSGIYHEWDITPYVNTELAGDKIISLRFSDEAAVNIQPRFSSDDAASNQPVLVIVP